MTNLRMSADDRRRVATAFAAVGLVALVAPKALAQDDHVLIESDKFEYKAGPASLDEGAEYAVLYGNPGEAGLFAMRLKVPDGFHIAPHHHEQPEVVTVISGTFRLGMGEEANPDDTTVLEPGSFFAYPPGMVHYAYAEGDTVIQLNSTGPWTITYIHGDDDPRM